MTILSLQLELKVTMDTPKLSEIEKKLQLLDELIRAGESEKVRRALDELQESNYRPFRAHAADFGNICRRVGRHYLGLRWLRPFTRPIQPIQPPTTPSEWVSYAGLLAKVGAQNEALKILEELIARHEGSTPFDAYFHFCSVYFQRWEYIKSVPILRQLLRATKDEPYQNRIAEVNWIAALLAIKSYGNIKKIHQRHIDSIDANIESLLLETKKSEQRLLHGNLLELKAQNLFFSNLHKKEQFDQIFSILDEANKYLTDPQGLPSLYVKKWRLISKMGVFLLFQVPEINQQEQIKTMEHLNSEFNELLLLVNEKEHWESLRELEMYHSILNRDENSILKVFFGTPSEEYQHRIVNEWQRFTQSHLKIPATIWLSDNRNVVVEDPTVDSTSKSSNKCLDPYSSQIGLTDSLFVLFQNITKDLYRPISEATLFNLLFPNEFFNEDSSPGRVFQTVFRLRTWFEINQIPLKVSMKDKSYRLEWDASDGINSTKSFFIKLGSSELGVSASGEDQFLKQLKELWPYKSFSTKEAAEVLKISQNSAMKILKAAVSQKKLHAGGSGRSTRYFFGK